MGKCEICGCKLNPSNFEQIGDMDICTSCGRKYDK